MKTVYNVHNAKELKALIKLKQTNSYIRSFTITDIKGNKREIPDNVRITEEYFTVTKKGVPYNYKNIKSITVNMLSKKERKEFDDFVSSIVLV